MSSTKQTGRPVRRTTLEQSIRRAVVVPAAVVLVAAAALHVGTTVRQQRRIEAASAKRVAQEASDRLRQSASLTAACADWAVDRLLDDGAIVAAALWTQAGERLAARSRVAGLLSSLDAPPRAVTTAHSTRRVALDLGAGRADHGWRIDLPIHGGDASAGPGAMSVVVQLGQPAGVAWLDWLMFALPAGCVAIGAHWAALRYLRARVTRPLQSLSRAAAQAEEAFCDELASRADEVGALAQALADLREESTVWREHAWRVERRMDSNIAERTLKITRDLKKVQRQVWIDPLTGVKNRRLLQERLPAIFQAQAQAGQDLSVVMIDLDNFKQLNDALGHSAGDDVLAFAGELLRQCTRPEDLVARYGGDEFVLVLPNTSAQDAARLTERIIALFRQQMRVVARQTPTPGLTAGVASLKAHRPPNHRELLRYADRALYAAKQAGKGCAHVFGYCDAAVA